MKIVKCISRSGFYCYINLEEIAATEQWYDSYNGVYDGTEVILRSGVRIVIKEKPEELFSKEPETFNTQI